MATNLYVKHRPKSLDQIVGNEVTVQGIRNLFSREKGDVFPHSFLFYGPKGCGKTTLARILADLLECNEIDLSEVDVGDFRGIDTVREIRNRMQMSPSPGSKCRVWIFDEVHSFTNDAQRALLKALEDTPEHVYFMLCTTDPQKLLDTILDRCTKFPVSLLKDRELTEIIRNVVKTEGWDVSADTMKKAAKASLGSARNALVILDQIRDLSEDMIDEAINQIILMEIKIKELCQALVAKMKDREKWEKVKEILKGIKNDKPEDIRIAVIKYFEAVLTNDREPNMGAYWVMSRFYKYPTFNLGMSVIKLAAFESVFMVTNEEDEK